MFCGRGCVVRSATRRCAAHYAFSCQAVTEPVADLGQWRSVVYTLLLLLLLILTWIPAERDGDLGNGWLGVLV